MYSDFGIEIRYISRIIKELATIYARLINQNKFKYNILFSASSYRINEEDQRSDETELFINLNIIRNLTESDINNIDINSQLEHSRNKGKWLDIC